MAEYLCTETIRMTLESQEREEAVRALLQSFVTAQGMPDKLVDEALAAVLDREKLGSTAIGRGVAVPHARLEELERVHVAFGYSPRGVEFNALDRQPVHEIFLVIAPRNHTDEYVSVMERITRLVQNADFRRFVARADTPDEILELVKEMDR